MHREPKAFRLNPAYVKCVEEKARELRKSESFIMEWALYEMFKHRLPPHELPGRDLNEGEG